MENNLLNLEYVMNKLTGLENRSHRNNVWKLQESCVEEVQNLI